MNARAKIPVAIIGSGNIGTDLMIKVLRLSDTLTMGAFVGIDPASEGLARAGRIGVPVTAHGIEGLVGMPEFSEIALVFDATSARAHARHDAILQNAGKRVVDLTPAAVGPFVVPPVNGDAVRDHGNVNMVTCGGQATIPIVAAVASVATVHYAEIVASIASRSAGPGTRANIDEFTETTARAIEQVGGARKGKAIIILNPAEPPVVMRDTVFCLCEEGPRRRIVEAVEAMVERVRTYVPGYRLRQSVQIEPFAGAPGIPGGLKVSVFLEVEGAGHYLPAYAGNLDIMTSAALQMGERMVAQGTGRTA